MAEAGYGSGGSWLQMSGSLQYFLGDVLTGAVHWEGRTHVTHARSDPGFPHCECVHGSRVRNTILALPLKQRQSGILVFVAASTTHAKISCILV